MKRNIGPQQVRDCSPFPVKHLSGKRIKWLSLATCLGLLLVVGLALAQGVVTGINGAHAATASHTAHSVHSVHSVHGKHSVSVPKHASSPSIVGKSKPVMSVSPLSLSFTVSLTQTHVFPTQTISIKDTGVKALYWHDSVSSSASWLTVTPLTTSQSMGIRTPSDQPGQLTVGVKPVQLTPGVHTAQITLSGVDREAQPAGGSPQTVVVTLNVTA